MTEKGKRPDIKLELVSKANKEKVSFVLGWLNDEGDRIGCVLCKEIESVRLADGRVVRPENVWVNFYDNRDDNRPAATATSADIITDHKPDYGDEDSVPF